MVKGTFTVGGKDIHKMVSGTFVAFSSLAHTEDFGQIVVVTGERFSWAQETELVHTAIVHYTPDRSQAEITLITAGGGPAGLDARNEKRHQAYIYPKMEILFKRNGMEYSELKTEKIKKDPAW